MMECTMGSGGGLLSLALLCIAATALNAAVFANVEMRSTSVGQTAWCIGARNLESITVSSNSLTDTVPVSNSMHSRRLLVQPLYH